MWRIVPLFKMTLRIVLVASVLTVVEFTVWHIFLGYEYQPQYVSVLLDVTYYGALVGLYVSVPMVLATVIFFREIRRPRFYRASMTVLAFIGLLVLLEFLPATGDDAETRLLQGMWLLIMALLVFACSVSARIYAKESFARKLELEAQEAEEFKAKNS